MEACIARERRKFRKLYLDNKKVKKIIERLNSTNSSDINSTYDRRRKRPANITHVTRKRKSAILKHISENDLSVNHSIDLQTSSSNPHARYVFSDISNVTFDNNNTGPSSSKKRRLSVLSNTMKATNQHILSHTSSITKLKAGKHILQSMTSNTSNIPLFDLTSELNTNSALLTGISTDYIDHGDQNVICSLCHAKLWKDEAQRGKIKNGTFSLCCGYGKVELPNLRRPPANYERLFLSTDAKSKNFISQIRRYNSMFAFTSMGGKVDKTVNKGKGPYIFRISGQNFHSMGSLLPQSGSKPQFSQLYIYDTENENLNRQNTVRLNKDSTSSRKDSLDIETIQELKDMLDSNNVLVQSYRKVRDCFNDNPDLDLKLRLIGRRFKDGRTYNLPSASEVAALVVGDITEAMEKIDIIVEKKSGQLKRINELHPSYIPLQYPLLFPFGDDGYRVGIPHRGITSEMESKRPTCTMREFFAFRVQDRVDTFSIILNSRRLFQQFLVDGYTMIESERLHFIRGKQSILRSATYEKLRNIQKAGSSNISDVGQRVILPSSFTGGSRYMTQNYLDAMAICRFYGYPDFFITFTCNPKWPEVIRFLKDSTLKYEDRPDIVCRLFKIKLDKLIRYLKDSALFGKIQAVVYTIEFQKRGLPHSHICLFMHPDHRFRTVDHIDPYISAEIPNIDEDPVLYSLVSEFMMHGPCGAEKPKCPCMVDNKCSKRFPKKFNNHTSVDSEGFPQYRRRDNGTKVERDHIFLDNRSVVPYNKTLLKKFQAHINVEWCNQAGSIKYLFKYITKGPDRTTLVFDKTNGDLVNEDEPVDEIKDYYDCRYISACESTWRIFGYDIHYRTPSVLRLPFHLPNQQQVIYAADDDIENVIDKNSVKASMFDAWMNCNEIYPHARNLTYAEFPTKFVFLRKRRTWVPRQKGFAIGRLHSVPPKSGEGYFLRMLLNKVRGPTCFEDLLTVNGQRYQFFRDVCFAMGLLDDDKEFIEAIKEGSFSHSGHYLRFLFASLLMSNSISMPQHVWNLTWEILSDGILYYQRRLLNSPDLSLSEKQIQDLTLFDIESILLRNNYSLKQIDGMPYPDHESVANSNNLLISEELAYDIHELQEQVDQFTHSLTDEQKDVFQKIMHSVEKKQGGVFFLYGYGGTGKTFLWKALSAAIRARGQIVLNVASSGIASLLLTGGRTAHSRFRIPIRLNEDSICTITPDCDTAKLLRKTELIIWDEAPMIHKHAFEALDRSLKDILKTDNIKNSDVMFGGKVVVFGGDFRQILPVVTHGSRQDIVNASLSSSYIWDKCEVLKLTKNMRLNMGNSQAELEETKKFAKWLLDVGEGKVGGPNDGEAIITIPEELLITDSFDPIGQLIQFVYPSILQNSHSEGYFQERAILAPKHDHVNEINDRLLSLFPGAAKEYLSSDKLCDSDSVQDQFDTNLCSTENLNALNPSGLPNHRLVLKVGVPVMLLRNIDQKSGLCNGTRLQVVALGVRVIEVVIVSGTNIGHRTLIARMSLSPPDNTIPFDFRRRQFPLAVCFAMTINKSQGQSLNKVGLFLKEDVFTHGQLYVALSRVKSKDGLKVLILDKNGSVTNTTKNVVFKEVFRNL